MLALSPIPLFDRKTIPPSRPATLGEGGRSLMLPLPTIPTRVGKRMRGGPSTNPTPNPSTIGVMLNPEWTQGPQATARLNQRLSTELKFRTRLYQSR